MKVKHLALLVLIPIWIQSCSKVPITGRKQMKLLPETTLIGLSKQQYTAFLSENRVSSGTADAVMVKRVGQKLQRATIDLAQKQGFTKVTRDFRWEFNLVEDKLVNAFCMPGGKVVIYTGILPVTQSENGLAIVMGHEIAHAVARHGNERMSMALAGQVGLTAAQIALAFDQKTNQQQKEMFMVAAGLGYQLGVMLPFSRKHESEADAMGLIIAAHAGYNPTEGIAFWQRMNAKSGGQSPPQFLSTHPSHSTRITDIRSKYLPAAMKYYKKQ